MNNKILDGYLKDFSKTQGFDNIEESVMFEYFSNNAILSKLQIQDIDLEDVHVGGGNDGGIDGIAIIVNDHLVKSIDEVMYHKRNLGRLEVKFYFIGGSDKLVQYMEDEYYDAALNTKNGIVEIPKNGFISATNSKMQEKGVRLG